MNGHRYWRWAIGRVTNEDFERFSLMVAYGTYGRAWLVVEYDRDGYVRAAEVAA